MRIDIAKLLQIDPPLILEQECSNSLVVRDQSGDVIFQSVTENDIKDDSIEMKRMQWIVMVLNEVIKSETTDNGYVIDHEWEED